MADSIWNYVNTAAQHFCSFFIWANFLPLQKVSSTNFQVATCHHWWKLSNFVVKKESSRTTFGKIHPILGFWFACTIRPMFLCTAWLLRWNTDWSSITNLKKEKQRTSITSLVRVHKRSDRMSFCPVQGWVEMSILFARFSSLVLIYSLFLFSGSCWPGGCNRWSGGPGTTGKVSLLSHNFRYTNRDLLEFILRSLSGHAVPNSQLLILILIFLIFLIFLFFSDIP